MMRKDIEKGSVDKKSGGGGFTLIELLVVLAIIGILTGLVGTAAAKAMKVGRQARDVHNMKQVGMALITDAMDNNGAFRMGASREDSEPSGTTAEVMQGLLNDGILDDPNVLIGEGSLTPTSMTISDKNVGFQYVAGHSGSSASHLPLLFTKGIAVDTATLISDKIGKGSSAWGTEGVGVCYVGGNAMWIKGKVEGNDMKLVQPLGMGEVGGNLAIYK